MKNLITCLTVSLLSGAALATTWTVDDDGLDFPKADFDNIQASVDADEPRGGEREIMPCDLGRVAGNRGVMAGTLWTAGFVYYDFDASISQLNRDRTRAAMDLLEAEAGMDFIPRTNQLNYIHIIEDGGNYSAIGMQGGSQTLSMYNWDWQLIICHELIHALGRLHQQSRSDRDDYITVNWECIDTTYAYNYNICTQCPNYGEYDFLSVMHYSQWGFNIGCPTMTCLPGYEEYQDVMGQRDYLSYGDIETLQFMYPPVYVGACCVGENCSIMIPSDCSSGGGTYFGDNTNCNGDPCYVQQGACCLNENCSVMTASYCSLAGGTYLGDNTNCNGDPCNDPQTGVCCLNKNCSIMTAFDCAASGGGFYGGGTNCQDNPCINSILNVPGDFQTIQAAVDAAIDGDEILVMPGTYMGTGNEVVNLLGKAVWLHSSNGQGVTIIDGEGTRRGIYCVNGETLNTVIEGFTITNGYSYSGGGMFNYTSSPTLTNCIFENNTANNGGGGMYNQYNSSPTLTNCTFTGNTAYKGGGGGMYNQHNSSPTLTNCTFNNTANYGGGMSNYDSSPTLTDCTFTNNTANSNGGGIYNYFSSPTLTNCTFTNNTTEMFRGGGMYNYGKSSPTLTNCTFTNNTANYSYGGGMSNYDSSPTLTNCTFENNTAIYGGGMDNNNYSDPTLTDCTFTNNAANSNGGGIYNLTYSNPTLTDTTLCGNTPNQIYGEWTDNGGNTFADVCPTDCPADINGDGIVNVTDLLVVIDQWGLTDSPADLNFDGIVDVSDLLMVVGNWGPCE